MTKLVIKWALLAPVSLFMAVFARLLCPVLPLFANDEGYLPSWLWWFQTPFDSLDGDQGSWERNPGTDAWSTCVGLHGCGETLRMASTCGSAGSKSIRTLIELKRLAIQTLATTLEFQGCVVGTHTMVKPKKLLLGNSCSFSTTTF